MKRMLPILTLAALGIFPDAATAADENLLADHPHVVLTNGVIEASVFLPDADKGFYRSTRFDWSGIVWQLKYRGHTYFTRRVPQKPHNPLLNESGMSLAGEFDIGGGGTPAPLRFAEAKPGETFMKIGVGNLVKPDDGKPYFFAAPYRLADPGIWKSRHGRNWVEFTHTLRDAHGFGYVYTKRMEFPAGRPELIVSHFLKNTGTRDLSTYQYCHNFFIIDHDRIGKHYLMDLIFPARFRNDPSPRAVIEHGSILLTEDELNGAVFSVMDGYGDTSAHNRAVIRNTRAGAGVDIGGDFPLAAFHFFAEPISFCPEFFISIEATPGETRRWTRTYRFFAEEAAGGER